MNHRYYSTQRPVSIGTYPKPAGNKIDCIVNFASRTYIDWLHIQAWGYIDYEQPLNEKDASDYELIYGGYAPL